MKIDLTTRYGYDIVCGLRGPDAGNMDALKWFFTAALRGICGARDFGYYRNQPVAKYIAADKILAEVVNTDDCYHYLDHQERAFVALYQLRPEIGAWAYMMAQAARALKLLALVETTSRGYHRAKKHARFAVAGAIGYEDVWYKDGRSR